MRARRRRSGHARRPSFRMAYHEHPDTFVMPGIELDREACFAAGARKRATKGKDPAPMTRSTHPQLLPQLAVGYPAAI